MKNKSRVFIGMLCFFLSLQLFGQEISGTITDESNHTLPGVNVIVKGTTTGAVSNFNGEYKIRATTGDVLTFSFIGYQQKEVTIGNEISINIQLEPKNEELDEVVVVGYGTQDRSAITAAISSTKGEELQKLSTSDIVSSLQGRVSGVQVSTSGSNPGDSPVIMIRGISTINNNAPLFVVDDAPVEDISFLTPNDIADVQILKDASAAAIYGSRGSNGVIIITTVKGTKEKLSVVVEGKSGLQSFAREPLIADAEEYEYAMAQYNGLAEPLPVTTNTNWFDEIRNDPALMQNYSISISGGEQKAKYNFSSNYYSQDGIIKGKDYRQLNARLGVAIDLNKKLSLDQSFVFTNSLQHPGAGSEPWDAMRLKPTDEVYLPEDERSGKNEYSIYQSTNSDVPNLVARINRSHQSYKDNKLFSNTQLTYKILEGFTFKSQYSFYNSFWQSNSFSPEYFISTNDNNPNTSVSRSHNMKFNYVWNNTLTFKRMIQKHSYSFMLGNSIERDKHETLYGSGTNVPNNQRELRYLDAAVDGYKTGGADEINSLASFFSRATYGYDDRYFITLNARADASSRFSKNNQWAPFFSFSGGWNLSNESFMESLTWLNNFKIRGGWGQIGNQDISNNARLTPIRSRWRDYITGPNGERRPGAEPEQIGNPELIWETVTDANIGTDIEIFNTFNLTFDIFNRITSDMLMEKDVPPHLGYPNPSIGEPAGSVWSNIGSIQTKGWDATLSYQLNKSEFSFNTSLNLTRSKATVKQMANPGQILYGSWTRVGYITQTEDGGGVSEFYGYEMLGIFQNETDINNHADETGNLIQPGAKPGDIIFADIHKDGKIDEKDRTYIGDPTPDFYYGLSISASYKAIDISATLQGTYGNDIVNAMGWYTYWGNKGNSNIEAGAGYRAWNGEGSSYDYPRLAKASADNNFRRFSAMYIENGSFLRVQDIQIGYTIRNLFDINTARFYLSAQNPFTLSYYKGMDPDLSGGSWGLFDRGIDWGDYPTPRTVMIGIRLGF